MEFVILLPVYNHLEYTRSTLKELTGHLGRVGDAKFHIILIDDGSTDGTSEWVKTNHPEVILLNGNGNLWWSGAVNLGAAYAMDTLRFDYLILWNNDIKIDDNYFSEMIGIVNGLDTPVVIGSKIYVAEQPNLVWSAGGYFNPRSGKNGMYGYFENDNEELNRIREVDWLTGMGTVIPREVVDRIGYWDNENFPQYYGDSDFTYRAKLEGFGIRIHPSLKIYNQIENSGIEHQGSIKNLIRLITDVRSKSNLRKNLTFYRKYAKSPWAYLPLFWLYMKILGGFIKWKIMNLMGIRKQTI